MLYWFICFALLLKFSNAQVTAIDVVTGKDADCPSGYYKFNVDLNKGSGGEYIYLCTSNSTDVSNEYITGLYAIGTRSNDVIPPQGYTKIDIDLNSGTTTQGRYIYLYYTRDTRSPKIWELAILYGPQEFFSLPLDPSWVFINQDLNEGAHGEFIYLLYQHHLSF